ncbi:MAG TPA: SDR family oxidoreductase [Acidobacteriaceae bacterium]|nr:SDR family oxidoreductase [Acidobacteriaceae bacterium]
MQNDVLTGKISVITGASAGIGAAIAKKLATMGSHCILIARDQGRLKKAQDEIAAAGGKAESHICDLSDPNQIDSLTRKLLQAHGRCDILVNNAGIGSFGGPLHLTDLAEWEQTIAINLRAPYLLLRAFAPGMIAARSGHIINISSLASKNPVPNAAAYAASKWGLNGMMVSAAEELRQHQVRVSLIAPGSVQTGFGSGLAAQKSSLGAIQPEDIADIVALLATQADQSFISEVLVRPTLKK